MWWNVGGVGLAYVGPNPWIRKNIHTQSTAQPFDALPRNRLTMEATGLNVGTHGVDLDTRRRPRRAQRRAQRPGCVGDELAGRTFMNSSIAIPLLRHRVPFPIE